MIIDTHVHIGKILNFNMKKEDVLYSMEKYGIENLSEIIGGMKPWDAT